jgi:hypothetical protein
MGTSEETVGPQQSALLVFRLKTRVEARLKNPHELNRPPQPLPQLLEGPDWQPD